MAAAVENDIEEFIRNQKAKLQQERQYLSVRFCMMLYIYSSQVKLKVCRNLSPQIL